MENVNNRLATIDNRVTTMEARTFSIQVDLEVLPSLRDSLPKSAKEDISGLRQDIAFIHADADCRLKRFHQICRICARFFHSADISSATCLSDLGDVDVGEDIT